MRGMDTIAEDNARGKRIAPDMRTPARGTFLTIPVLRRNRLKEITGPRGDTANLGQRRTRDRAHSAATTTAENPGAIHHAERRALVAAVVAVATVAVVVAVATVAVVGTDRSKP